MIHAAALSLVLLAALALCLLAPWRHWAPSLRTALAVGVILRAAVWLLAATRSSYDVKTDFAAAAAAVLHHHDPLLTGRDRG